jgi:general secretion pathway protein F
MDAFPHTFPPVMRGMVRLGEESGNLAGFLDELRQGYRRVIEEPGQAVTAFIYPLAVTVFTNIMLGALFLGVLPRFRIIADQMGLGYVDPSRPLFLASQLLLGGCVLAAMIMMTGGSAVHFGVSPVRFAKGLVDRLLLWTPLFSGLVKNAALHQFCTAAGLMARAGAALPEAATTAASGERNVVLRARLTRLAGRLAEGAAPGEAFRGEGWMPPAVSWFVEAGASSRDLGENLLAAGAHFQAKWLFLRQMAMRAIVPVLILLNGLLVLMTMLAVFGPIVRVVGVFTAR